MGLSSRIDSTSILYQEKLDGTITSQEIFGNDAPLHIEIGSGKGKVLLQAARNFPDQNFLGLEKTPMCLKIFAQKNEVAKLDNARAIHCYLEQLFDTLIPDESLESVMIYFPDPWPKKRHRKRRFFVKKNIEMLLTKIREGGELLFKSDFEDYYTQAVNEIRQVQDAFVISAGNGDFWMHPLNIPTNFQIKYAAEGKPYYYLSAKKISRTES